MGEDGQRAYPSPERLAADLAAMLRGGVTFQTCTSAATLLRLDLVRAKAASGQPDDLAAGALSLIAEACARVDGLRAGATAQLLGLAPGTRGALLKDRRRYAAAALFISPEHLRKDREGGLLAAVADELFAMDAGYRRRHQHRLSGERPPEESALAIDWLAQHRSYHRIWTPIAALRADLLVLLDYLQAAQQAGLTPHTVDDEQRAAMSDRLTTMTWRLAQFSTAVDTFVQEDGGLWLLAAADDEIQLADAMHRLEYHLPFGDADVSWARLLLRRTEQHELDPYIDALVAAGERRAEFMACWIEWAWTCVQAGEPNSRDEAREKSPSAAEQTRRREVRSDCARWLAAAQEFVELVEADWYRVADWYRREATGDEFDVVALSGLVDEAERPVDWRGKARE